MARTVRLGVAASLRWVGIAGIIAWAGAAALSASDSLPAWGAWAAGLGVAFLAISALVRPQTERAGELRATTNLEGWQADLLGHPSTSTVQVVAVPTPAPTLILNRPIPDDHPKCLGL